MKIHSAVALFALVPLAVSCGGDGGGSTSTDTEFCEFIRTFDKLDPETDLDQALAAIDELTNRAPSAEVKQALEDLRPIIGKIAEFDPTDEAALAEIMPLLADPKVIAASDVLDTYSRDVCGFDQTDGTSSPDTTGG